MALGVYVQGVMYNDVMYTIPATMEKIKVVDSLKAKAFYDQDLMQHIISK